jgi:catechol 2,3-dioxygenase-like lactoylglutathione lyase family enzyme
MPIRAVSHVAVGVTDMERSLRFYRDVLGLSVSLDATEDNPAYGEIPAAKRRGVYLRWRDGGDESFIVLDQHDRPGTPNPRKFYELGIHHYGFWVTDIDAIVARAKALGEDVMMEPVESDTIAYGLPSGHVVRSALLRDPDGNIVQLDQR